MVGNAHPPRRFSRRAAVPRTMRLHTWPAYALFLMALVPAGGRVVASMQGARVRENAGNMGQRYGRKQQESLSSLLSTMPPLQGGNGVGAAGQGPRKPAVVRSIAAPSRRRAGLSQVVGRGPEALSPEAGWGRQFAGVGRRAQDQSVPSSLSNMVVPVVLVLVFLLVITLMKECARMLWRRALLRTINNLKTNQEVFVMGGVEYAEGEAPLLESGRWSIKWQDGHRERYTSLTLRVDPVLGTLCGTGRDSSGECVIEGVFNARRDRIAWTQTYSVRRHQMQLEAWGFLRRDGVLGPVVGRGQYQTNDALGSRGAFVLRPVLVESIIAQIMDRIHLRPRPPDRAPVKLKPLPEDCEADMDMTCAICLEDNTAPRAASSGPSSGAALSSGAQENPSGMLPCGHAFHEKCIQKWLQNHDVCPSCKHVVRAQHAHADDYGSSGAEPSSLAQPLAAFGSNESGRTSHFQGDQSGPVVLTMNHVRDGTSASRERGGGVGGGGGLQQGQRLPFTSTTSSLRQLGESCGCKEERRRSQSRVGLGKDSVQ